MAIIKEGYDDYIVNGKRMREWYKSDGENVDYSLLGFKKNISTDPHLLAVDYGTFVIDDSVFPSWYHNGIDVSRLAGTLYCDEPYDDQRYMTSIDGDDVANILRNNVRDATVKDLVFREYKLVAKEVYISAETKHVMITFNVDPQDDVNAYAIDYNSRIRGRSN